MKFLKFLIGIIVVLAIILVVGSFFLPKSYSVSRSITINAADNVVYKNIADFNQFLKWNAWSKMEPTAKVTITGDAAQPGHLYKWEGKQTGTGQMKIEKVEPNKMVDIELKFLKPYENTSDTKFDIIPEGSATKVTWTMSGENNMIGKWMCVFMGGMDKMIGKDFENGLKDLKELSEKAE